MKVGQRIKDRRKELKMSADELGAKLGKNRATIYRYENGDIEKLPLDILEPIAKALETTPQFLMGWNEVQKKNDTLSDIVVKLRTDEDFSILIEKISKFDDKQLERLRTYVAFLKDFQD